MKSLTKSINGCARCHGDHEGLVFEPLTHPIKMGEAMRLSNGAMLRVQIDATHWAPCPTNGEPILMAIFERGDDA